MKIYEAKTLTAATKSRAKQYEELKKEVDALKKEFQGIVGLDHEFQGAGAVAIKSFYEAQIDVADAWIELFTTQISFLEGIPASLEEADLSGNTVVEVPFLDGEVSPRSVFWKAFLPVWKKRTFPEIRWSRFPF
ncbi:hypothetical protein ASG99_13885 [Bacillus sp. Soil768D1]|nr:hypothetical protein ASG99_13885 [Bacillus sp. Soil768D1]